MSTPFNNIQDTPLVNIVYDTSLFFYFVDFVCDEPHDLLLLLDSSNSISDKTWSQIKTFAVQFAGRMNRKVVNIDFIVFGDRARFVDSSEVVSTSDISKFARVAGPKRLDIAMLLAKKSFDAAVNARTRKIIVIITSDDSLDSLTTEDRETSMLKNMQSSGIEMYTMVVRKDTMLLDQETTTKFGKLTSKPIGKYMFSSKAYDISKWSTVLAMKTCRSD